jgi:hypothetical protein
MAKKQRIENDGALVWPAKHTRNLTFDGKSKKMQIYGTPYLWKAVTYVMDREKEAGRAVSFSRTVRALLLLGIEQYRKLNRLPSREV